MDKNLSTALLKAQAGMGKLVKDSANPQFSKDKLTYASLAAVLDTVRGPLTDAGIVLYQSASNAESMVIVRSMLIHAETGESIEEQLALPVAQKTPQALGSAITYGRRYLAMAMCGLAPDDDDANDASQPTKQTKPNVSRETLGPGIQHRQPPPPTPDLDADVDFGMGDSGEPNPFDDDTVGAQAEPAATVDPALQKKLNILNSLGNTFYNKRKGDDAWDKKREEIAKPFNVTSSTALTGAQIDTLIAGLEKRTREIIAQMGGIPADIVTECTAFGKFAGVDSIDQARGVGLAKCLQWAKANSVPAFSAKPTTLYA